MILGAYSVSVTSTPQNLLEVAYHGYGGSPAQSVRGAD